MILICKAPTAVVDDVVQKMSSIFLPNVVKER